MKIDSVTLIENEEMEKDDGTVVTLKYGHYELINHLAGQWVTIDTDVPGLGIQTMPIDCFKETIGGLRIKKGSKQVKN